MRIRSSIAAAFVAAVTLPQLACAGTVWYVDATAAGGHDGTSWADAFTDLQDALAAAGPGDEIWVRAGTYTPSESDATASFHLTSGVGVYGGFAGWETAREQRNWDTNVTILSGDIGRDDVVGSGTYWYVGWNRHSANSGHVVVGSGTDRSAVLDGFTIADGATGPDGTPASDPLMFGSGLYNVNGSPTVRNCTFMHNLAAFAAGGAIYNWDSSPSITHCRIIENYVHLGRGGGIFNGGTSAPVIEDCLFARNHAVSGGTDAMGGGMDHEGAAGVTVLRCTFDANEARSMYPVSTEAAYGGGLASYWPAITVRDCVFTNNAAMIGGGFIAWGPATVVNSVFRANKAVPHPADPWPEIGGYGAGVMIHSFPSDTLELVNCTVAFNTGKKDVGVLGGWNGSVNIRNCVVWGNVASHPDFHGYWREQVAGGFDAAYSCIQNIFGESEAGGDVLDPADIPGCIDQNPLFVGASDLHVMAGSPTIDAGKNAFVPTGVETDLDGLARFVDDPGTADSGVAGRGHTEVVDLGAFEVQVPPCPADFNGDGAVNTLDFIDFLNAFSAGDARADWNDDGTINTLDFLAFLNEFNAGC